ncbi:MAG: hypothetical protein KC618_01775, partial [Candidatus Omnitrophica bacterium]|nr:hypothetical protein [Candidatus Omnitrophota bacterium]
MGAFTISSIAVILCCWPLAVLSFLRHQGKKSTIMWGVFCAFIGFWGIASFFASTTMDKAASTMWWRFATIGSIMSPPTFYHFTHLYFEEKRNWILVVVYTMAAFFLYSNFFLPGLFLGDVWLIHNEFYFPNWTATKGILFVIFYFSFFVVLLSYSLWLMIKGFRKAKGQARNKIKYFFVGMFFGWIGVHGDF